MQRPILATGLLVMPFSTNTPLEIAGYSIIPLSLPPLPSFPQTVTHFLYLAQHQPRIPTPTASRSLFLVNVPFDATEIHLKHLLSTQIGLPAGRIEDVQFAGQRRKGGSTDEATSTRPKQDKKTKKRKRESDGGPLGDMEDTLLPSTWDRDLQSNGLTAVVLFVDRASMDVALKALKTARKGRDELIWGEGVEGKAPALGSASWCPTRLMVQDLLTRYRIPQPPPTRVSQQKPTSRIRQHIHDKLCCQGSLPSPFGGQTKTRS